MAKSGISAIDGLFDGGAAVATGSPDRDAVGLIQDLLTAHGATGLPGITGASRGVFGPATTAAVRAFQQRCGVQPASDDAASATVDAATLRAMIETPTTNPVACCGYLSLVLDVPFTGLTRLMCLTAQFEGSGRFAAHTRNRDRAGLSFGLIQWAQSATRLNELLRAFRAAQPQRFVEIFGGGDADLAQRLIDHTAKPRGGTTKDGRSTDPAFELSEEPWTSRFRQAALDPALQRVQLASALAAFRTSLAAIRAFAPQVRSERAVAFLLDVANQHGDEGARSIFDAVGGSGLAEPQLLEAMEQESVRRVTAKFGAGSDEAQSTAERRRAIRTSPFISDAPFDPS
jgi:peptidoglycan hydrolase-like protein with peptidoglycan-binding domain